MRFIIFATLWLLLQLGNETNAQWCTRTVPTKLSRTRMVTKYRLVSTRNWLGMPVTKKQPYSVPELEYYNGTRTETYCCNGYTQTGAICLPTCTPNCPANSHCIGPNQCACYRGYSSRASHPLTTLCKPICSSPCPPHSACTHPEYCGCEPGYTMLANVCQPICDAACPTNANCTAPNTCTCQPGYDMDADGECAPVCATPCDKHSHCAAPDQCECDDGYDRPSADMECQPQCRNGCPPNAYCQQPERCACRTGYRRTEARQCAPICGDGCAAHSTCVAPNECRCLEGYALNATAGRCEPHCPEPCPAHSVCAAPNECRCADGYRLQNLPQHLPYCEPLCALSCSPNGKCVAPNVCECFDGYESPPLCQPRCSLGCTNGTCFAPELCVCDPGYLMGPNNSCAPTCSLGCTNGVCVEPEICACARGYSFANNSVHACVADCTPDCINADCAAPDFCVCRDGHQPKTLLSADGVEVASAHECEPSCEMECVNGYCTAPNSCRCNDGYAPKPDAADACEPQCADCQFGNCTAPGVCECWAGYERRATVASTSEPAIESAATEAETAGRCVPLELTTTTADTDATSSEATSETPQLHHKVCNTQCKCWQPASESSALTHAKCAHICLDDYDQPCLNLSQCSCDAMQRRLVCPVANDFGEETPLGQVTAVLDDRLAYYSCKVLLPPAQRKELRFHAGQTPEKSSALWPLIGGCVAGGIVVLALAAVVWRYVHNRNQFGVVDVPLLTLFSK